MASQKEDEAFYSNKNEESTPPVSVKEAASKVLLNTDVVQPTEDVQYY
jgi:hypothetical protein